MKPHLHKEMRVNEAYVVEFQLSAPARVMFLDKDNYLAYKEGFDYDFYGTETETSPFYMAPPHTGWWHLVVESTEADKDLEVHIRLHER